MGGSYQLSALGPSNLSQVDGGQLQLHFLHSGQHLFNLVGVLRGGAISGGNSVIEQNRAKLGDLIHGSHSNLTRFSCVSAEDTNHIVWHAALVFVITFSPPHTQRKFLL